MFKATNRAYEDFLTLAMERGVVKKDRTGTGTRSIFGHQMRFNLQRGFPLVTTKKVHLKSVILELLWMLRGDTNVKWLQENGCTIWDEWARADGDLGPVYGAQWRSWSEPAGPIDQISEALHLLRTDPDSRRIVVSAWNVADLPKMALMPCHALFQFWTHEMSLSERLHVADDYPADFSTKSCEARGWDRETWEAQTNIHEYLDTVGVPRRALSCQLYQRSADMFLGVPFNIASYALLTHMMAQQVGMAVGDFVWTGGDCHIYSNHEDQVVTQLSREVRLFPKLKLRKAADIFSYQLSDVEVEGYNPHPAIKAPVAV